MTNIENTIHLFTFKLIYLTSKERQTHGQTNRVKQANQMSMLRQPVMDSVFRYG